MKNCRIVFVVDKNVLNKYLLILPVVQVKNAQDRAARKPGSSGKFTRNPDGEWQWESDDDDDPRPTTAASSAAAAPAAAPQQPFPAAAAAPAPAAPAPAQPVPVASVGRYVNCEVMRAF